MSHNKPFTAASELDDFKFPQLLIQTGHRHTLRHTGVMAILEVNGLIPVLFHFMALFQDYPGKPVPEEKLLLDFMVQGKISEADTPTIGWAPLHSD